MKIKSHARLSGKVKVAIVEDGRVVREFPWQDNLILDQGLDYVASTLWNQLFTAVACGTGTNPTGRAPTNTATMVGNTITANAAGVFVSSDVDADVVFHPSLARFKIQAVAGDGSSVTVFGAGSTITSPSAFTLEYVGQTILGAEVKRTSIALGTPGACITVVSDAAITLQRTWQFSPEATQITYTELGLSPNASAGNNLFSRILLLNPVTLSGPTVNLPNGQQLQVTYQLIVQFDYGQGPGNFFSGTTPTSIIFTNLPVNWNITSYANSATKPGFLAVTVTGQMPALPTGNVILAGSSVTGYDGTWIVLDTVPFTDPTNGASTILSLQVAWAGTASGGTLTVPPDAFFFRPCQGIYQVGSVGQSQAPSPTPDVFLGYGEPSVLGSGWISTLGFPSMGSNLVPTRLDPTTVITGTVTPTPYAPGSFTQSKPVNIAIPPGPTQFNLASFGYGAADLTNQIETYCWLQPRVCQPGSSIQIVFNFSWGRGGASAQ